MPRRILDIVTSLYAVWTSCYNWKVSHLTIRWGSGHGTYVDSEEVIASVAGTVERVNKLVTVRAIRSRSADKPLSTVIIWKDSQQVQSRGWRSRRWAHNWGKVKSSSWFLKISECVSQVQARRWKVDANSRQDAVLMLSSVNLPGGVQVGKLIIFKSNPPAYIKLLTLSKASQIRKRWTPDARIFWRRRSLSSGGAGFLFWWCNVASHTISQIREGTRTG